ncbi:MAG TPA: class IV adenylate cyclase [Candidatus Nanoarchaeia archaeon]|nr:class IV adenylate cyclase [Candidatus Nanoarchaeia archaeon]
MEEIEVKIIDIDPPEIIRKLQKLGAKKVFDGEMNSIYFDCQGEFKKSRKTLRLRQKGDASILTLKIKKDDADAKVHEELETTVGDFETAREIFRRLGFQEVSVGMRRRISFKIKKSLVELDFYQGIPPSLEVESPRKEELKQIVELLGYTMEQTKRWSGKKLLEHYRMV